MAQKLNKKLVFVVGSLLLVLVLGGGGVLLVKYRYDAERHVRAGEQYLAEGDPKKAAEAFGRAVRKKPNNIAYLEMFRDATLSIVSDTENDARERYGQYIQSLSNIARAARDDADRWRAYLAEYVEQCEGGGSVAMWKSLGDRGDEMLKVVRPDDDAAGLARLYRGYAALQRAEGLTDAERASAAKDLAAAAATEGLTDSERALALGSLARLASREIALARAAKRDERVAAAIAASDAALAACRADDPDGLQTRIAEFERAVLDSDGELADERLVAAREALTDVALTCEDGTTVLATVSLLARAGRPGLEDAAEVLGAFVGRHADALMHRRALALVLRTIDRTSALAEVEAVLAASRPSTSLVAATFDNLRASAALLRFDMLFDEFEAAPESQRAERLESVRSAREQLATLLAGAADDSPLLRADGKIALAEGKSAVAAIKFNEVFRKGSSIDLELHLLGAMANLRQGESGRALQFVNDGLKLAPSNSSLLKMRAELEMRAGRPLAALQTITAVASAFPDDADAQELLKRIETAVAADPAAMAANDPLIGAVAAIQDSLSKSDFATARSRLAALREGPGKGDARVDRLAVAIEMQADELDEARRLLDDALGRFPGDPTLTRYRAILASDDPVERVLALSENLSSDPATQTVMTYLRLRQVSDTMRAQATREQRLGTSEAARMAETAKRLEEGAAEWRRKAEEADRAHPVLLEADFQDALAKGDFAAAEAVIRVGEESKADPTQVVLQRAQLLSQQDKRREAIDVLERAMQQGLDNSLVTRLLGAILEESGNLQGALAQYEDSYAKRPSDMQTVRLLVGALIRAGNPPRALDVLRSARQLAGLDQDVGEIWLSLESQAGDRRLAMRMRENQWIASPADAKNAAALAAMLATSAPEREDVVDERGNQMYSIAAWTALDQPSRLAALDRTRTAWRRRAEEIFRATLARVPGDVDTASAYANMLRSLGRGAEGEQALARAVDAAGPDGGWRGHVMLGLFRLGIGDEAGMRAAFEEAVRREVGDNREATRAIVDALYSNERFELAIAYLEPLAAALKTSETDLRLAECYMRVDRLDEARRLHGEAMRTRKPDLGSEMLDGAIDVARGDLLREAGRFAEAIPVYESAIAAYSRAKQMAPAAPQPFVQDAMLKRKLFELTGDRNRGQEALAAADRAVAIGASFYPACAVRSEVLLALGDVDGALRELERFLGVAPTAVDARRRQLQVLEGSGRRDRAEESLRQAIGFAPGEPGWHVMLGDMLVRRQAYAEAAESFARADSLAPDGGSFVRRLDALIRGKDYRGVLASARDRGELVKSSPAARAYLGIALLGLGEATEGRNTLRDSLAEARAALASGDAGPASQWYSAFSLAFLPTDLENAQTLLMEVSGGDPTPIGYDFLAGLALSNPSAGPSRAVELLAPVATMDFSSNPLLGGRILDRVGMANYLAGNCEQAVAAYERALELLPTADQLLNNYAYLCIDCLEDASKGLQAARKAVQLQPTRPEYLDTLGEALAATGELAEAMIYLDRAVGLAESASVQLHRAGVLERLGKRGEALEAAERGLRLSPDPKVRAELEQLQSRLK